MSQEDLARTCMVSRQTISNWETGKTLPDIQSMTYLAEAFGITVGDLVDRVAPELVHRVSIDKRELLLLILGIIFIGVLYKPLEWVSDGRPHFGFLSSLPLCSRWDSSSFPVELPAVRCAIVQWTADNTRCRRHVNAGPFRVGVPRAALIASMPPGAE